MHMALTEEIEVMTGDKTVGNSNSNCLERWRKVFTNCFIKVDNEISGKTGHEPVAPETVGSTAVVSLICSSHVIVANCGDSRAVLCRGKEPIALSNDHKVRPLKNTDIDILCDEKSHFCPIFII